MRNVAPPPRLGHASRLTAVAAACAVTVVSALTAATVPASADPPAARPAVAPRASGHAIGAGPSRRLDAALLRLKKAGSLAAVSQVVDTGRTWQGSFGKENLRTGKAAQPSAQVHAASVTKMFTTVLAMRLVDSGEWTLRTTIGDVLPGLKKSWHRITVGQLLNHTTGIPDAPDAIVLAALKKGKRTWLAALHHHYTDAELVKVAAHLKPEFRPGTDWAYSNTNFIIVGMMLEKVTGQKVGALMKREIFAPAGMRHTRFALDDKTGSPFLHEYAQLPHHRRVDLGAVNSSIFGASGALLSTPADLNRFQAALQGGRLISPSSLAVMRTPSAERFKPDVPYGHGMYRLDDPCNKNGHLYGHDGASFGVYTMSFASTDGRRRVAVSTTGREYTKKPKDLLAMFRYVEAAIAVTCGSDAPNGGTTAPPAPGRAG